MIIDVHGQPLVNKASIYPNSSEDSALARGMSQYDPRPLSGDAAVLPILREANAKAADLAQFHTAGRSALQVHVDQIVGHQWKLKYMPNWRVLGISEEEAHALAYEVESRFEDWFENPINCVDAEENRTGTMMARATVMEHTKCGEVFAKSEWRRIRGSPYRTCLKLVNTDRISNPRGTGTRADLREGVKINQHGAAQGFYVRSRHQSEDGFSRGTANWDYQPKYLSNGRVNFIHVFEPESPGQNRGANTFLSAIGKIKHLDKLQDATLQNAIVNAMYAAVIKSDLPSEELLSVLGEDAMRQGAMQWMLGQKAEYHDKANIRLNKARIPHLLPGEELQLMTAENPGQSFADFESSILRDISRGVNLSYESFSRDYSKTNYSSARASMLEQLKYMLGKRKVIVEAFMNMLFSLWLEEAIFLGIIRLPRNAPNFYQAKRAWTRCQWIGSGRLMIDELKEVKAAVARLEAGISTYERESAHLGMDFEETIEVQNRETTLLAAQGRVPLWAQQKGNSNAPNSNAPTNDESADQPAPRGRPRNQ